MALNVHLFVNDRAIGYLGIQRVEGESHGPCEYRATALMNKDNPVSWDGIHHNYDDGALELIRVTLEQCPTHLYDELSKNG